MVVRNSNTKSGALQKKVLLVVVLVVVVMGDCGVRAYLNRAISNRAQDKGTATNTISND